MGQPIRKLRHWKQRWDPNAAFICRRRMVWEGRTYEPGAPIPEQLAANRAKLRRFWESQRIELAECEPSGARSGQGAEGSASDAAPGAMVEKYGRNWYRVTRPGGSVVKVQGKAKLDALLAELGGAAHG